MALKFALQTVMEIAAVVDGEKIKADTWYKLENGEFVEAADE